MNPGPKRTRTVGLAKPPAKQPSPGLQPERAGCEPAVRGGVMAITQFESDSLGRALDSLDGTLRVTLAASARMVAHHQENANSHSIRIRAFGVIQEKYQQSDLYAVYIILQLHIFSTMTTRNSTTFYQLHSPYHGKKEVPQELRMIETPRLLGLPERSLNRSEASHTIVNSVVFDWVWPSSNLKDTKFISRSQRQPQLGCYRRIPKWCGQEKRPSL
ncbi:hypothetical protein EV426DRAFT_579040 [Tirmania nivea]|nr:hypothetical protein EV426DRAFT_579040 [Tirmania nivea]